MPTASNLRFEWVTDTARFMQLRDDWDAFGASAIHTVFLTFDWLSTWLEELAPLVELHVLTAWDGDRLVAALPLCADPAQDRGRRWTFMGVGTLTPNHLDIIAEPDGLDTALAHFAARLLEERANWDVLEFDKIPADSSTVDALQNAFAEAGLTTSCSVSAVCPYCDLPSTAEEYAAQRKKRIRKQIRGAERWLDEKPGARRLTVADSVDAALAAEAALVRFHQARWEGKGYPGAFADPRVIRFHERMVAAAQSAGYLRMYTLRDEDEVVAVSYNYRMGATVQGYLSSFDYRYAEDSPGLTLRVGVMNASILDGATRFDFLEGTESYKASWCSGQRENVRLSVFNRTLAGRAAQVKLAAGEATVHLARAVLPEGLRERVIKAIARKQAAEQTDTDD
ncbi:MAG: GNAT family N-acetyltransferase [Coriobacteriia bacterium]|nr:GNAT family N-acetyltransferase [Coriobacteriia bacterium]